MSDTSEIARRYVDLFNADPSVSGEGLVAGDISFSMNGTDLPPGMPTLQARMAAFREAAPDRRVETELVIDDGADVAIRYRVSGTHTGTLRLMGMELPASNREFSYLGAMFLRVEDGLVVREVAVGDLLGALTRG